MKLPLRLLPIVSLVSSALAQGFVSPAHFTLAEGNTYAYIGPGSTTTPDRILQVHDDLKGTARTLSSFAFRRDAGLNSPLYDYLPYTVICDIFASTAATSAATVNANFDSNHGSNKTQVSTFGITNFPATKHRGAGQPFEYRILFGTPYAFDGANGLCLEVRFNSKTNTGNAYMDFQNLTVDANPPAYTEYTGTGCKTTGSNTPMFLQGGSTPNWPSNSLSLSWSGTSLPKSSLVYLCLGGSDTTWGALPLPLPLPGTNSAPSGTCTVYCDWSVVIPVTSSATGSLTQSFGFPANTSYNGQSVYSQVAALDSAANFIGLVTTNRVQHQVIAPFTTLPVSIVYAQGGLPVTGTVLKNQCYPIRFQ